MIENPMDVLKNFPIRKNKKQKQTFRDSVQSYLRSLGYEPIVEKVGSANNLIAGDPDQAKILITAHYDTPAGMIIPNLITPCSFWPFMAYQLVITVGMLGISFIPGLILTSLGMPMEIASRLWILVLYGILALMLFGPANKSNANDNTSGVVTVLETAASIPEAYRDKVCFVLFDLEEAGLIGSAGHFKKHKKAAKEQLVLNCDCVGDGNELMMFPMKKVRKNEELMENLRASCMTAGEKSLQIRESGFAYYPSDQKHFPYGIGIAAFNRSGWAGLYCDKIHTKKDTVLDENNVSFLRDRLIEIVSRAV